jgi:hypothetical protein
MTLRQRQAFKAVALFLAFAVVQVSVQITLAGPSLATTSAMLRPQTVTAKLTSSNPVLVNGNSVSTGATILTGATIETGDQTGATIDLGPLGSLDLPPNARVVLEYDDNGNVKVKVLQGCAILKTKKGTHGEIDTEQGKAAESDKNSDSVLNICFPPVAAPVAPTAGAAGEGLGTAAWVAIIAGGAAAAIGIPLALRGDNPSPSNP